jgi:cytochrome P450
MNEKKIGRALPSASGPTTTEPAYVQLDASVRADPLKCLRLLAEHGDIVRYPTSYGPVYLINEADGARRVLQSGNYVRGSTLKLVLGEGLLASDGPYWRRQRRLMQPAFHQQRVAGLDGVITGVAAEMLGRWREFSASGQPVDVASEMPRLTLRIIAKALFSVDLNDRLDAVSGAVTQLDEELGRFASMLFTAPPQMSLARNRRFETALREVDRVVQNIIVGRRGSDEKIDDWLGLLLSHRGKEDGKGLTDRQIRDEAVTMLLAGHVTTANALSFTWYLLARHPAVEARVHDEVDRVLGRRVPTARDIPELRYTRMVLHESLRLYPPVWFISRKAVADDVVGGCRIPTGAAVVVSPYLMHRHPAYWKDPERFDPERFALEGAADRSDHAYLPFGTGQHACIGAHLAMLEGQLILATVAQRYKLGLAQQTVVEPEPALTLKVRDRLPMILQDRL